MLLVGVDMYQFNTNDIGASDSCARTRPSFKTALCFASSRLDEAHPPHMDCIDGFHLSFINSHVFSD
jgi:hypothetical protein